MHTFFQRWRRRWFVLQRVHPPAQGRFLLAYYSDERVARDRPRKPKGIIKLEVRLIISIK